MGSYASGFYEFHNKVPPMTASDTSGFESPDFATRDLIRV
jgi:hypothetical protein